MTTLKEQAVKMLYNLPDDKMAYIVDILKSVTGILDDENINFNQPLISESSNSSEVIEAWEELKKYKSIIPYDIDAKAELAKARDEKYANFN